MQPWTHAQTHTHTHTHTYTPVQAYIHAHTIMYTTPMQMCICACVHTHTQSHHQSSSSQVQGKGWWQWHLVAGILWGSAKPLKSCLVLPGVLVCCHCGQQKMDLHLHVVAAQHGSAAAWWPPGARQSRKTDILITWQVKDILLLLAFLSCMFKQPSTLCIYNTIYVSRVPDQNSVSLLYIMLEIHHSGQEPSIFNMVKGLHLFLFCFLSVKRFLIIRSTENTSCVKTDMTLSTQHCHPHYRISLISFHTQNISK